MEPLLLGLRVVVSLAAVFGLMWLVHRKLRGAGAGLRARALSVVARQSVGPKASVVLVDTDGKRFLLGVTEHGINVLHATDAPVLPVPDPSQDAFAGGGSLPPTATRRSVRQASFDSELERQRDELGQLPATAGPGAPGATRRAARGTRAGSVLEPGTWRLAAEALRSGRRP